MSQGYTLRWIALGLALAGCGSDVQASGVYIALGRDFEDFESWVAFDRGLDPVPPTHEGTTSMIYVDELPPTGSASFPMGTRIVRVEQRGDDPSAWEVHAMVKRGGGYNAGGALDWEFFGLVLTRSGDPWIEWRGEGPMSGDGYVAPDGSTEVLGCNHCHASARYNDSVLSPALDLGAL
jgi:hypothetical protein